MGCIFLNLKKIKKIPKKQKLPQNNSKFAQNAHEGHFAI
jgi:hypothetical protein